MGNQRLSRCSSSRALLLILLIPLLPPTPLQATQVRPINLEEMTQHAARIVSGRCVDVRTEIDPALKRPITLVTLEVDRTLKGAHERSVTLRMAGGFGADGRPTVAGMPRFRRDEELILFLYGESRSGLTSPVGLGQGKFRILRDAQDQRLAVNESAGRTLFSGLSPGAAERMGRTAEQWRGRGGIPPEALLELVEKLQRKAER